jgi:hypothetical protein
MGDFGAICGACGRLVDRDAAMTNLMASVHSDGKLVFDALSDLHDNTADVYTARLLFVAMVRIRVLEQRIEEIKAEVARLEAVARVGY